MIATIISAVVIVVLTFVGATMAKYYGTMAEIEKDERKRIILRAKEDYFKMMFICSTVSMGFLWPMVLCFDLLI